MPFLINSYAPMQLGAPPFNTITPVLCCGFECGQVANLGNNHFVLEAGAPTISTSTFRTGSRSFRSNPTGVADIRVQTSMAGSNFLVVRLYIRFAVKPNQDCYLICTRDGGASDVLGLAYRNFDGKLYCAVGSTMANLGASPFTFSTNTWYRVDLKIDQTIGAKKCDAKIDGTTLGQATGTGGTTNSGKLHLGTQQTFTAPTADVFYDDVLMSYTAADYPLGAGSVQHFVPTADGTHNTGAAGSFIKGAAGANITNSTTDAYLLIDDVPMDDQTPDTNDYITQTNDTGGGALYTEHIFGPASGISTPSVAPRAVDVVVGHHGASAGTHNVVAKLVDQGQRIRLSIQLPQIQMYFMTGNITQIRQLDWVDGR
jgi:hypothetical protein